MNIFLSSTSDDLKDHRNAVVEVLEKLGHRVVRMERFSAAPETPVQVCLSDIATCKLFVGLYAHRYGCIPRGFDESITELELRKAQESGLPCLCFVVDPKFDWPPPMVDDGAKKDKLNHLKSKISESCVRGIFTTPENLASQVITSVVLQTTSPASAEIFFQDRVLETCIPTRITVGESRNVSAAIRRSQNANCTNGNAETSAHASASAANGNHEGNDIAADEIICTKFRLPFMREPNTLTGVADVQTRLRCLGIEIGDSPAKLSVHEHGDTHSVLFPVKSEREGSQTLIARVLLTDKELISNELHTIFVGPLGPNDGQFLPYVTRTEDGNLAIVLAELSRQIKLVNALIERPKTMAAPAS